MDDLEGLLAASPDAVVIADREGEITRANRHVEDVLGYEPAAMEGMAVEDLLDPADRETHREHRAEYMADPEPRPMGQDLDLYAIDADGERVPVEIGLGPVEVEGETRVVATISDATEREERLESLQSSEGRYRRLLDISPAPIVIYDAEGVIQYANQAVADLLDVEDSQEVVGDEAIEYVHEADREATREGMRRLIEDREPVADFERRLVTPDGDVRHAILSSAPITYADGPAAQVLLQDVTSFRERERELERQNERLDEFASIVSHDLRNPLSVLEASLDLARESDDPEHFERAERAVDRMNRLVENLLSIARHGQPPEETEPLDLGEVATAAWRTVETPTADLDVRTDREVEAEPTRLQELFENLFRNAVDHAVPADGTVTVCVADCEDGFAVADDGTGIAAADSEAIFERGYSTDDEGTGYGLAIVEEIAEAHDWTVDVEESDAGGARFVFATG